MRPRVLSIVLILALAVCVQSCAKKKPKKPRKLRGCKKAEMLLGQSRAALGENNLLKAEDLCEAALDITHSRRCKPKLMGDIYFEAGRTEYELGNQDQAEAYLGRAFDIMDGIYRIGHSKTLRTMNYMGRVYTAQGRYGAADDVLVRTLEIARAKWGQGSMNTVAILDSLGRLNIRKEDYVASLDYFKAALKIRKKNLDSKDPELAAGYHNVGDAYFNHKKYDRAEPYYKRAIRTYPAYYMSNFQLGMIYKIRGEDSKKWGDFDAAVEHFETSAKFFLKADYAGTDYYNSLNLGRTYELLGDVTKDVKMARVHYRSALKAYDDAIFLGKFYPEPFVKKAIIYDKLGREVEALSHLDRAIELKDHIGEVPVFPDDLPLSDGYVYKARLLQKYGRYHDSLSVLEECLLEIPGTKECRRDYDKYFTPVVAGKAH